MCGIAGYLSRRDEPQPVGRILLDMLTSLARRGPDSAGVALFRTEPAHRETCWIRLPESGDAAAHERRIVADLAIVGDVGAIERRHGLLRVELGPNDGPAAIRRAVERGDEEIEVVSVGRQLELIKQVGHPDELSGTYPVEDFRGTHAIGHTRLSTESRVDLTHSQPFWARGVADLATVHNGHITNYHKLRRMYEQEGTRFYTENDSEVIGVYLARKFRKGQSLREALAASVQELDGSFSYLVATADAFGFAKDAYCLKPMIVAETPGAVAIANEEVAIQAALGAGYQPREPGAGATGVWEVRRPAARPARRRRAA